MLRIKELRGAELLPHLDALAWLRIAVFREFPYLYAGSLDYEREYLLTYVRSPGSLVCLAFDGDRAVGATTCLPMLDEGPEFQAPFLEAGYQLGAICYFGESILLAEYRGRGLGKEFFNRREAHANTLPGVRFTAFCAVDRPENHPQRPPDYRPLDAFWASRGYVRHSELQAAFTWKEIGQTEESAKPLTFWLREWI